MNRLKTSGMLLAAIVLAAFATPPALAGQENTTKIQGTNLPTGTNPRGLATASRTSDAFADYVFCGITGNNTSCSASNNNTSTPKNIGTVACIPKNFNAPQLTSACAALLNAGSGNCQANSAAGWCNPRYANEVKPACNYRTDSSSSTPANWTWTLDGSTTSNGALMLDCSQTGFQGYSQN